jgi:hypothetical protein
MVKTPAHKWTFASRFRARCYGWRSSRLACERIKEALSEIKAIAKNDPLLAGEGAVKLIEKLSPALEQVDSSSGSLGTAVNNCIDVLVSIIAQAPADAKTKAKWLDRLWDAFLEDDMPYIESLGDHWGDLCEPPEIASKWADYLLPPLREAFSSPGYSYFQGTSACLAVLLKAGRYQELLDVLEKDRVDFWPHRIYGARALIAMRRKGEAIRYAKEHAGQDDVSGFIEETLLSSGIVDEAYKYAIESTRKATNLATFRAIVKKYPNKDKAEILKDLIASTPGEEGKWFAAAKDAGLLDLAMELVQRRPADPKTLNRAARDFMDKNPKFALGVALASLGWMAAGYGYEITSLDVGEAARFALKAASVLGVEEEVRAELRRVSSLSKAVEVIVANAIEARLKM